MILVYECLKHRTLKKNANDMSSILLTFYLFPIFIVIKIQHIMLVMYMMLDAKIKI